MGILGLLYHQNKTWGIGLMGMTSDSQSLDVGSIPTCPTK